MKLDAHELTILATVIGIALAYVVAFLIYEKTLKE